MMEVKDRLPKNFEEFVEIATQIFVEKNTDYGNRFTRALMKRGRVIWEWEVEKKLERIRSWITRGELLVKDEGVSNSVHDLFNYTIIHRMYLASITFNMDPLKTLSAENFGALAGGYKPQVLIKYLQDNDLIERQEVELKQIITKYMSGGNE